MNEPTEFGPYNEAISRRYGIGSGGPVGTVASDAFPVFPINDAGMDPDMQFLAGSFLGCASDQTAPVELEFSQVVLENPTNSGVICTVDRILLNTFDTAIVQARLAGAIANGITVVASSSPRDTRNFSAVGTFRSGPVRIGTLLSAAAVSGSLIYETVSLVNVQTELHCTPIILRPGSQLLVGPATVNVRTRVNFVWKERRAGAWELLPA